MSGLSHPMDGATTLHASARTNNLHPSLMNSLHHPFIVTPTPGMLSMATSPSLVLPAAPVTITTLIRHILASASDHRKELHVAILEGTLNAIAADLLHHVSGQVQDQWRHTHQLLLQELELNHLSDADNLG